MNAATEAKPSETKVDEAPKAEVSKAEQQKDAAKKAAEEEKLITCVEMTVRALPPNGCLRLTEVGAMPLYAGSKFLVPIDVGMRLIDDHPQHLEIQGRLAHNTPTKKLKELKHKTYEITAEAKKPEPAAKKKPTDTGKPGATKVGEGQNKSMADRDSKKA